MQGELAPYPPPPVEGQGDRGVGMSGLLPQNGDHGGQTRMGRTIPQLYNQADTTEEEGEDTSDFTPVKSGKNVRGPTKGLEGKIWKPGQHREDKAGSQVEDNDWFSGTGEVRKRSVATTAARGSAAHEGDPDDGGGGVLGSALLRGHPPPTLTDTHICT